MKFIGEKFLILGLGRSGKSCIEFLLNKKASVYIFDDNQEKMLSFLNNNKSLKGLEYQTEYHIRQFKYIIVSPGIKPNHNLVSLAKLTGTPIISEIELFYLTHKPFLIGITGSNGKTTTAILTQKLLEQKYNALTAGNIGKPLCDLTQNKQLLPIVETSSFQLEYVDKLRYNISVILNLHENHLDWHFNLADYIKAKSNIYKNSKKGDILILNLDDKQTKKLNFYNVKCRVLWFSTKKECKGIYVKNDKIYLNIKKPVAVCDVSSVSLMGEHNLQNVLVAVLIAKLLKVKNSQIEKNLQEFLGLEHRLEYFYNFRGVSCFNDSKSTTTNSTLCAISALKNYDIILLLGGKNKGLSFNNLAKQIPQNVKQILLFGEDKQEISQWLNKYNINHILCKDINQAILSSVTSALSLSAVNDSTSQNKKQLAILFSPCCTSFDNFNNYKERGIYFKEYLKSCVDDILNN